MIEACGRRFGSCRYHFSGFGEGVGFLFLVAFGAVEPFFTWRTQGMLDPVLWGCLRGGRGLTARRADGHLGVQDVFTELRILVS